MDGILRLPNRQAGAAPAYLWWALRMTLPFIVILSEAKDPSAFSNNQPSIALHGILPCPPVRRGLRLPTFGGLSE